MIQNTNLSTELEEWRAKLEAWAKEYGLDFYETIFEVLDWNQINMVAAYSGFPNRYPHWRFGMEYEQLAKSYSYGLSKIYEMVINNDPCYAYLLHSNNLVDQKMVMAHVFAHCDFFKNNIFFGPTPRNMMDQMAFLLEHAPLSRWEYDVLHIVRNEAYYFAPQAQTKIMNEGWASYWHSKIMTEKALLDSELIDFADHHSGTVAMTSGRLNPYKI